jgi:hypothetical protein
MGFCIVFTLRGVALFFLLAILLSLDASSWDLEYWQTCDFIQWKKEPFKLYAEGEIRLNKMISPVYYYRITQGFVHRGLLKGDLEVHLSYIWSKSRGSRHFKNRTRLELEINPYVELCHGISLKWRNRLELIKHQGIRKIDYVFRHRAMIVFPIENRKLKALQMSDEIFYHFRTQKFTQNRWKVVELVFAISPQTTLNAYIMVRNFLSSLTWYRSIVLGSEFEF